MENSLNCRSGFRYFMACASAGHVAQVCEQQRLYRFCNVATRFYRSRFPFYCSMAMCDLFQALSENCSQSDYDNYGRGIPVHDDRGDFLQLYSRNVCRADAVGVLSDDVCHRSVAEADERPRAYLQDILLGRIRRAGGSPHCRLRRNCPGQPLRHKRTTGDGDERAQTIRFRSIAI